MTELWQLYDEQGRALNGEGASKDDVFTKGLLHGASHVWIWRHNNGIKEVLIQRRAADKRTWPSLYDISAAGHIDLGESPLQAALRETKEEIGLDIDQAKLQLIKIHRAHMNTPNGAIENEHQWLYLLELLSEVDFTQQEGEVSSLLWKPIEEFKQEVHEQPELYVPHGNNYFDTIIGAIEKAA